MVIKHLPDLSYFRRYNYKTYPLNKHIPRKDKFALKAYIGLLIKFKGTNIYNIWIPSQKKVIRIRNVIFNENKFYNPKKVNLIQLIKKPFFFNTLDIFIIDLLYIITEIPDINNNSEEKELLKALNKILKNGFILKGKKKNKMQNSLLLLILIKDEGDIPPP